MPRYEPVAASTHATQRWQRYSNYAFAATDAVAPLVVQELPKACMTLPIAFIQQGEAFVPAAVQGLQPGQNLFVLPDGRWIGPYTPATYSGYCTSAKIQNPPFRATKLSFFENSVAPKRRDFSS